MRPPKVGNRVIPGMDIGEALWVGATPSGRATRGSCGRRPSSTSSPSTPSTTTSARSFLKFCTSSPYTAKLCINGNEWAKRQAAKAGIGFEALDNGFASCDDPVRLQRICNRLGPRPIDRLLRKWLTILPHPFTGADRRAGYRYAISVPPGGGGF